MGTKDTYLGLTFKNILTGDVIMPKQWIMTGFATRHTGMGAFNSVWWNNKKKYRDRFLYNHLLHNIPYHVTSIATGRRMNEKVVNAHYSSVHGGAAITFYKQRIGFAEIEDLVAEHMAITYPGIFNGDDTMVNSTNPDEVITYVLGMACWSNKKCVKKPPSMTIRRGGQNFKVFSYSITGTAVDSGGNPVTGSYNTDYVNLPNNYINGRKAAEVILIWYKVAGSNVMHVDIRRTSSLPAGWVINFSEQMVPAVPIQWNSQRAVPNSPEEKYVEWFMERLGLELRADKKKDPDAEGIYDILDKRDKDNDGGSHTQKQVDNAYIICTVEPRDPYVVPQCGWVASEDVANFPYRVLQEATPNTTAVGAEPTSWYIACNPPTLRGSKTWWMKKNKLRRHKFAKIFYQLLHFYKSNSVSMSTLYMSNSVHITQKMSIKTGKITHLNGRPATKGYTTFNTYPAGTTGGSGGLGGSGGNNTGGSGFFGGMRGSNVEIVVRKQITDTTYEQILVTELTQQIRISGESFTLFLDGRWRSSADEDNSGDGLWPQLWVPKEMFDKWGFIENIIVKEYGTKFLFFSKVIIETSWVWVIILIVVTIIVCVYASPLCPSMVTMWGGVAGTASVALFAGIFTYVAVMVAVNIAIQEIAKQIDDPWLRAAFLIVATVVMAMMGNANEALTNPNFYLPLAASITTIVYNTYVQIEMEKLMEEKKLAAFNEQIENKQEIADDMSGLSGMQLDTSSHYSHTEARSPDTLYAQAERMYNFDQFYDVTGALDYRSRVVPA